MALLAYNVVNSILNRDTKSAPKFWFNYPLGYKAPASNPFHPNGIFPLYNQAS